MNGDRFSELGSAYLDGEVTAEDRTEMDGRLSASDALRQTLDDFQRLGDEIRSLPRERLPADFSNRVLATIEREMLLPPRDAAAPVRSGRWLRNGTALAATAAALVLSLSLLNPRPPRSGMTTAEKSPPATADHRAVVLSNSGTEAKPAARASRPDDVFEMAGKSNAPYREPLVPPVALPGIAADDGLVFIDDLRQLTSRDVGRVVTAVQQSDAGIAVVKLTVVDCQEGLNALQVLLSKHKIAKRSTRGRKKTADLDGTLRAGLTAVYVRSTPDHLASAVAALRTGRQFRRLEVDAPIAASRLDAGTRNRLAMLDTGTPARFRRALPSANRPPAGGGLPKSTAKTENGAATGAPVANQFARISQQLQLTLPTNLLQRDRGELLAARQALRQRMNLHNSGPAFRGGFGGKGGGNVLRPVRVLFVLECPTADPSRTSPQQ